MSGKVKTQEQVDWEEFNSQFPDEGEPPPGKPLTDGESAFFFVELYPDGTEVPTHKFRKPN